MKTSLAKSQNLFRNTARTIKIAWQAGGISFVAMILLTVSAALIPIGISYMFKFFIDELISAQNTGGAITVALISFFAFRYLLEFLHDFQGTLNFQYLDRILRFKMQNELTYRLVEKISSLDIGHFDSAKTSSLIHKANENYIWRIPAFMMNGFYIFHSLTALIGSLLVLIPFSLWAPAIMIVAVAPRFLLRNKLSMVTWSLYDELTDESKELTYLKNLLTGQDNIKEIKIFQATKELLKRLKNLQKYVFEQTKKDLKNYIHYSYLPSLFEFIVLIALAYDKLPLAAAGIITVGSFTFYIQNLSKISDSAGDAVRQLANFYENNMYVRFYFDVLDLPRLIAEDTAAHSFKTISPPHIEFRNVSFRYPNGSLILKNISFQLKPGEHLAIVGANGAGKTTLIKLLLRFYDPAHGDVMINDINLKKIRLENWYKFVSILFQDFVKFRFTVKENIMLGNAAIVDEEKMKASAIKSGAADFIEKLPRAYQQRLGREFDGGTELSQGQWQKLTLARAFYEEAPILVLDEPTSSIDAEAEAKIFENLEKLYKDKTLIMISHRFSTVRHAHKIIVLKNGEIAEEGNHSSLLAKNGIYAKMFRKQASGYAE